MPSHHGQPHVAANSIQIRESPAQLLPYLATFPLLKRFAYASDDSETMRKRICDLLTDTFIALMKQAAPLRVTKDDPVDTQISKLFCGNLHRRTKWNEWLSAGPERYASVYSRVGMHREARVIDLLRVQHPAGTSTPHTGLNTELQSDTSVTRRRDATAHLASVCTCASGPAVLCSHFKSWLDSAEHMWQVNVCGCNHDFNGLIKLSGVQLVYELTDCLLCPCSSRECSTVEEGIATLSKWL